MYDHELVPEAGCQLLASVETSTPPTTPPPLSVAVPVTVTGVPTLALLPDAGAVIVADAPVLSVLFAAALSPAWSVAGWASMSASRFTVACWMAGSAAGPAFSCTASRPQVHWTVPAPKTSARDDAR